MSCSCSAHLFFPPSLLASPAPLFVRFHPQSSLRHHRSVPIALSAPLSRSSPRPCPAPALHPPDAVSHNRRRADSRASGPARRVAAIPPLRSGVRGGTREHRPVKFKFTITESLPRIDRAVVVPRRTPPAAYRAGLERFRSWLPLPPSSLRRRLPLRRVSVIEPPWVLVFDARGVARGAGGVLSLPASAHRPGSGIPPRGVCVPRPGSRPLRRAPSASRPLRSCRLSLSVAQNWPVFEKKMRDAGQSDASIAAFRHNYEQLVSGVTGLVRSGRGGRRRGRGRRFGGKRPASSPRGILGRWGSRVAGTAGTAAGGETRWAATRAISGRGEREAPREEGVRRQGVRERSGVGWKR